MKQMFSDELVSEEIPKVEPIDIPEYKYKASKSHMIPKLPCGCSARLLQQVVKKCWQGT